MAVLTRPEIQESGCKMAFVVCNSFFGFVLNRIVGRRGCYQLYGAVLDGSLLTFKYPYPLICSSRRSV